MKCFFKLHCNRLHESFTSMSTLFLAVGLAGLGYSVQARLRRSKAQAAQAAIDEAWSTFNEKVTKYNKTNDTFIESRKEYFHKKNEVKKLIHEQHKKDALHQAASLSYQGALDRIDITGRAWIAARINQWTVCNTRSQWTRETLRINRIAECCKNSFKNAQTVARYRRAYLCDASNDALRVRDMTTAAIEEKNKAIENTMQLKEKKDAAYNEMREALGKANDLIEKKKRDGL